MYMGLERVAMYTWSWEWGPLHRAWYYWVLHLQPPYLTMWAASSFKSLKVCVHALSCPALCNPMDCSPPGSSVHRISQSSMLEWIAISFSRGSFWPRDWTQVFYISCIGRWILYHCTTWEAPVVTQVKLSLISHSLREKYPIPALHSWKHLTCVLNF